MKCIELFAGISQIFAIMLITTTLHGDVARADIAVDEGGANQLIHESEIPFSVKMFGPNLVSWKTPDRLQVNHLIKTICIDIILLLTFRHQGCQPIVF